MLDPTLKAQLTDYLTRLRVPVELAATLDNSAASEEMSALLRDVSSCSSQVHIREDGRANRAPSFTIGRLGEPARVAFAGIPTGHEFTSLVLALLHVGGHPPKAEEPVLERARGLRGPMKFEVYMSLSCHNCPDVVQALNLIAAVNPGVEVTTIDGALFQDEVDALEVLAVPSVYLNGALFSSGRMSLDEFVAKLDDDGGVGEAARLDAKAPFDVLVVGGGPAGAAAAVYAARKGIRTGIVADRFGGQTNDTLGIENYISVLETNGPAFSGNLLAQVSHYGVEVMNLQRVATVTPSTAAGGLVTVRTESGATLRARTVILATGARWRNINVPGEELYKNKGVAYCPHCDGPLFKGKRVAVIGGGNSGVEAAIDLAGLVGYVTVLEFGEQLRADAVLVAKLKSLANVAVHTSVQTTEITGDGSRVNGLAYVERASGQARHLELEGVFVQIGLLPNTEFLKGSVNLSNFGEIEVDAWGRTSMPGVFAAGDATTVPFKQIVIAAGDGAKASLSAFDHLMRDGAVAH
jgi:alkyl hydroperoxide reductase subunit F